MKTFRVKAKCEDCEGTGLYIGMGEMDGYAVVCRSCKGTGCAEIVIKYKDFEGKKDRQGVHTVLECNPGIGVGLGVDDDGNAFDFGGMDYEDWKAGKPFPPGSEMRNFVCPARWYQMANPSKKPNWEECWESPYFSKCTHYARKHWCWKRFDGERGA